MRKTAIKLLLFALIPFAANAEEKDVNRWNKMLHQVQNAAVQAKISPETTNAVIQNATFVPRVIHLDRNQPETRFTTEEYLMRMINDQRIQGGRRMLREQSALLAEAERRYNIPPRLLVAFWGLESNYGTFKASFDLPDAFLTLIYDGRRGAFFQSQLISLMKTADRSNLDITQMRGSWAGAMGHFQFIPTTLEQYGVDGDGDGKIDIINNKADAIMSAANYLNRLRFNKDERIVREVRLPANLDVSGKRTVNEWARLGVRNPDGSALPKTDMRAGVFRATGDSGRAWLTYDNFDRIKRWNNSNNYALAVAILMDNLK
ncbi:MAG: lytic murein transglycosylase [Alphaproteobacteria bacterium]|nr:lytic murein transglycosylase [Alphaproteobacteria bacterium]